jgi:cyanophycinase
MRLCEPVLVDRIRFRLMPLACCHYSPDEQGRASRHDLFRAGRHGDSYGASIRATRYTSGGDDFMWWMVLASLLASESETSSPRPAVPKGTLVAIGGGTTTVEIVDKTFELAGGRSAKVAIVAEANPETGTGSLEMWKRTGAKNVVLINVGQPAAAKASLNEASLIWMPGGLQGVFMNALRGTGLEDVIRRRYRDGAVVAGTSAGAAVMSKVMIGGRSDLDSLKAGTAPYLMDGLGLWPQVIVDQHFLQKGRFNRLALAAIDHSELVGIGIDEETAVIVRGQELEVIGENNVTVIDGRKAIREPVVKGNSIGVRNLKVHVLRAGMKYRLDE